MNRIIKSLFAVIGAALILICSAAVLRAELSESDLKEINQYKMTDKTLTQYFQATKSLVPVAQKNRQLLDDKEESEESEDSEESKSLSRLVQEFDAIPGATKAVQDAGMTTREYLTFQYALVFAASGHFIVKSGGELPSGYSKQNVEFYKAHEEEFKKHQKDFEIVRKFGSDANGNDDDDDEDIDDDDR